MNKFNTTLLILIVVVVIAGIGVVLVLNQKDDNVQPIPNGRNNSQVVSSNNNVDDKPIESVETPDINTEPEVIESNIDTSDWQTYRNEELGFEFKYPRGWEFKIRESGFVELKDSKEKIYFEGDETYLIGISTRKMENSTQSEEYIENWKNSKLDRDGWIKNIVIDNQGAMQGFSVNYGLYTLFQSGNTIYNIGKTSFEYKMIDEIYLGILNTFKIIN